jgi:hypothetical protein
LPARRLSDNGLKAWAQAVHRGYEGIVGKDPDSPVRAGAPPDQIDLEAEGFELRKSFPPSSSTSNTL